jgi:hypothetical protein
MTCPHSTRKPVKVDLPWSMKSDVDVFVLQINYKEIIDESR